MKKNITAVIIYFTVALLLGASVMPFLNADKGNPDLFVSFSESTEELSEAENTVADELAEAKTETEKTTDSVTFSEEIKEKEEQTFTASVSEGIVEEAEKTEFYDVEDTKHFAYKPGGNKETVSGLNFFTDTYGRLDDKNSINTYTFSIDENGAFRYTFLHDAVTDGSGWTAELYQEYYVNGTEGEKAYRLINQLRTTEATADSSPEIGLIKGNYRLVVSSGSAFNGGIFRISITYSESTKYETECNDNIFRYNKIYDNVPIKGSASAFPDRQDEDYYMLRMYSDGYIELDFSHASVKDLLSVCWQVILYSEDMTEIFAVNSTFDKGGFSSGRIGLNAGNYYIAVKNRVYTDMTYTLTIKRVQIEGFENERNDTMDSANPIFVNSTVTGIVSEQINGLDRDYFRLSLAEKGTVILEFSHNPKSDSDDKNGWNFSLRDENGKVIYSGVSAWTDDVSASPKIGLDAGTYYIVIDNEGLYHLTERYYLSCIFDTAENWETELNDSFSQADKLTEAEAVSGVIADRAADYDYDYYTFTTEEKGNITLEFTHEVLSHSKEIFTFTLFDEDKNAVASSDSTELISVNADAENTSVTYKNLPAGRYYVRVTSGLFYDSIIYSLKYNTVIKES